MESLLLGSYILVWPVISSVVLAVIVVATLRDFRCAKREGRDVV
ncbi:MAG: putative transporter small subunit [Cellvibrio sp.]